ncbi:MAG TPA: hypothetical protein DCG33_00750 [Prevotellaceae bacterium]|nr:hypothetical protein [Prevotellaceae bacterium]
MKRLLLFTILFVYSCVSYGYSVLPKFATVTPSGHTLYFEIDTVDFGIPGGGAWVTCGESHGSVHYGSISAYSNLSGHVIIPDSVEYDNVKYPVTAIGTYAFCRCTNLNSITFPSKMVSIGEHSFDGCTSLASISIPDSVTTIEDNSFIGCTSLSMVNIGRGVTHLGSNTFKNCTNLHVVYFNPTGCTNGGTWGNDTFRDCNALQEVYIGNNVSHMPSYLFAACSQLPDIYFISSTPPTLGENVFPGNRNVVAHVPCNSLSNYMSVLVNRDNATFSFVCFQLFDVSIISNDSTRGIGYYVPITNTTFAIFATSNYGYHFDHWSTGSTANPDTVILTGDTTIAAYFSPNQYALHVLSADSTLGSVNGNGLYDYLDTVSISATPVTHYHFLRWNDGNTMNPRIITITNDINYTAIFAIDTHSVSLQVDSIIHGFCNGNGNYVYGTAATAVAIPYSGYQFSHWSNGSTNNPYTFAVVDDTLLTAYFRTDVETYQDTFVQHDTLVVHDTIYITCDVQDTIYINHYVHDTTFINNYIHDTTFLDRYIYEYLHDTIMQYINHYIHDTTYINNYIHDTAYLTQYVHDTAFIYQYIHDTIVSYVNHYIHDTTFVNNYIYDTIYLYRYIYDTIYIHDTIYLGGEGIEDIALLNARIYQRNGQIVVEGAEGYPVYLYDVVGRLLATRRETAQEVLLDVPASGAYLVKIGDAPARRIVVRR